MRYILFLFSFIFLLQTAIAQDPFENTNTSDYFYYQLDNETYKTILKSPKKIKDFKPKETFAFREKNNADFDQSGNFIRVQVIKEQVYYDLISNPDFFISSFVLNDSLHISISTLSIEPSTFDVKLGNKSIKNHSGNEWKTLIKKKIKEQLLVSHNGTEYLFDLEANNKTQNTTIYNKSKKTLKQEKGYIAISQPVFRKGDTVKIKAILVNHKNLPVDDSLTFMISKSNNYRSSYTKPLIKAAKQTKIGLYELSFVVSDSFVLDEYYSVQLIKMHKKKNHSYLSNHFFVEDYELQNTTWHIDLQDQNEEGVQFDLWAKDANKLIVQGCKATIKVMEKNGIDSDSLITIVPKTVLDSTFQLENFLETTFNLKKEIFPSTFQGKYEIEIKLTEPSNETFSKKINFTYPKEKQKETAFWMRERNDSIFINNTKDTTITLYGYCDSELIFEKEITTPYSLKYDHRLDTYLIKPNMYIKSNKYYSNPNFSHATQTSFDSIFITFHNPYNYEETNVLYKNNEVIAVNIRDTTLLKTKREDVYFLYSKLLYKGNFKEYKSTFSLDDSQLNIEIKAPDQVYPGEKTKINIEVTDVYNQPVSGTDLTVLSITNRFEKENIPTIPDFQKPIKTKTRNDFSSISLQKAAFRKSVNLNKTDFRNKFGLDSINYYKFQKSGKAVDSICVPSADGLTYVSFYILKEGKRIAPYYIKDHQDLLYYYKTENQNHNLPSFYVERIFKIRTEKALYSLKPMDLKQGHQNLLIVNLDSTSITSQKRKKRLNKKEQSNVEHTCFHLHFKDNYHSNFTVNDPFFTYDCHKNGLIGPFRNNRLSITDSKNNNFLLTPKHNKIYSSDGRIIQSQDYKKKKNNKKLIKSYLNYSYPFYPIKNKNLQIHETNKIVYTPYFNAIECVSTLSHLNTNDTLVDLSLMMIRRNGDENIYFNTKNSLAIPIGEFEITYISKDKKAEYTLKNIKTNADATTYIALQNISWNPISAYTKHSIYRYYNPLKFAKKINVSKETKIFNDKYTIQVEGLDSNQYLKCKLIDSVGQVMKGYFITHGNESISLNTNGEFLLTAPLYSFNISFLNSLRTNFSINIYDLITPLINGLYEETHVYLQSRESVSKMDMSSKISSDQYEVTGSVHRGIASGRSHYIYNHYSNSSKKFKSPQRLYSPKFAEYKTESDDMEEPVDADSTTTITDEKTTKSDFPQTQIRDHFQDNAIWETNLITNQDGNAHFTVTLPDDITSWETYALGIHPNGFSGVAHHSIRSFKPLMASLNTPRFVIEGDSSSFIGAIKDNREDKSETFESFFTYKNEQFLSVDDEKFTDKLSFITPKNIDSVAIQYTVKSKNYSDSEIRKIPILKQGLEKSKGDFIVLNNDSIIELNTQQFESDEIHISIDGNLLSTLTKDIKYLTEYKYECNEQLSSKLLGNLASQKYSQAAGKIFFYQITIKKLIKKLEHNQNSSGLWGWWNGMVDNPYISIYVIYALSEAQKMGYNIDTKIFEDAIWKLKSTLYFEQTSIYKLQFMKMLAEISPQHVSPSDLKKLSPVIDSIGDVTDKLDLIRLKQIVLNEFDENQLFALADTSLFGNLYFKSTTENNEFTSNTTLTTLTAYTILKNQKGYEKELTSMRNFIVESRDFLGWKNTYTTAKVLALVLDDFLSDFHKTETKVWVNDEKIELFPYSKTIKKGDKVVLRKEGISPTYVSIYQNYWDKTPQEIQNKMRINTTFKEKSTIVSTLTSATPVQMIAEVEFDHSVDFVQIDIPIPAGCSYGDKYQLYGESHIEYYKDKVSVFLSAAQAGKRTFYVNLIPRYSGAYTLNPAEVQLMYFPIFSANTCLKKIKITENK